MGWIKALVELVGAVFRRNDLTTAKYDKLIEQIDRIKDDALVQVERLQIAVAELRAELHRVQDDCARCHRDREQLAARVAELEKAIGE